MGQFIHKSKTQMFFLTCCTKYPDCSAVSCRVLKILVCLLSNIMKLDATQLVLFNAKHIGKTQRECLFTQTMARLLKMTHRPCCERFDAGTIFPLLKYLHSWTIGS